MEEGGGREGKGVPEEKREKESRKKRKEKKVEREMMRLWEMEYIPNAFSFLLYFSFLFLFLFFFPSSFFFPLKKRISGVKSSLDSRQE